MTHKSDDLRWPGTITIFTILIVLSGLASLIYQVAWTRRLTLVFGVSTYAVATVLATFLGGLALGAWLLGRPIDRSRHPLRIYALLEAGIGLYAFAFPFLLEVGHRAYIAWGQDVEAPRELHIVLRIVLAVALLLPPTFLMGGTLPAMCRVMVREERSIGRDLGRVYGFNTLGAAAGALVAGFILLAWLGLRGTIWFAGGLNLSLALVAIWLFRVESRPAGSTVGSPAVESSTARPPSPAIVALILAASTVSGFAALGYEVLWTRALVTVLHTGFTYAFSLMLTTFLLGLVLGSFLYARYLSGEASTLRLLGRLQLGIGGAALASLWLLAQAPYLERAAAAAGLLGPVYTWSSWVTEVGVASILVMLVPTTLMGITLPLSTRLIAAGTLDIGRTVGTLYAFNTIGSILGALIAGFVLVPLAGTLNSLALLAGVNIVLAAIISLAARTRPRERIATIAIALSFIAINGLAIPRDLLKGSLARWMTGEILYFAEDVTGVAAIFRETAAAGDTYRRLYVNGTSYASTSQYARRYHKLLGHLPALVHPDPQRALVIAFGTGMTAGSLAIHPEVDEVDCVDLSEAVLGGAPYFAEANHDFVNNPKGRIWVEDGRHHLQLTSAPYDLITLEPPPPRHAGVANLYSRDFYELGRRRLRRGGVAAQWIPLHSQTEEETRMLVRSFLEVFPHSTLWIPVHQDAILVGSAEPIRVDFEQIARRIARPEISADLVDIGLDGPAALTATWFANEDSLARYVRDVRPITDDRPVIEFFAGHSLVEEPLHLRRLVPYKMGLPDLLAGLAHPPSEGSEKWEQLTRQVRVMDHYHRGAVLGGMGDAVGAAREWRRALELDPGNTFLARMSGIPVWRND